MSSLELSRAVRPKTQTVYRNDGRAKVTGRAQYADDYQFPKMVHAVPVFADTVRATIDEIYTAEAAAMPGVIRVITGADVPGAPYWGQIDRDMPLIAVDRINCEGDVVALVVAITREEALKAAKKVVLRVTELPPILDPQESLKDSSPVIRLEKESNLVAHHKIRRGDPSEKMPGCDLILEREFSTGRFEHAYLEPEGAVCFPRQDGVLEIYGSLQHPVSTRRFICGWLGLSFAEVEVFSHPVGGSFGGKDDTASAVCGRAALAAKLCGRAVKLIYDREWSFKESYKRPPYSMRYRFGFAADGELQAAEVDILADSGAYTSTVPWSTWRSTIQSCGPYRVSAVRTDVRAAATNNVFTGAFRGFGSPPVNFAVEQLMDEAAESLGMSEIEIRKRNMLTDGDTTITGQILDNHKVSLGEVLDLVTDAIDYDQKRASCSFGEPRDGKLYGIGLAIAYRGASVGAEAKDFCSCMINCQFDGSVLMETGIYENGQGAQSAMVLTLHKELGISLDRIRYSESTTSQVPEGGTTVASRGTLMGSAAVHDAVVTLKKIIADTLAPRLGCAPENIRFEDDQVKGGSMDLPWDQAMKWMFDARVYPFAFGSFKAPEVHYDEETGQGDPYFTYVYSCQAAEVEVEVESGAVKVVNVVAAHDIGQAVNPVLLEGQIYGGIIQGMGMALFENFTVEEGRVKSLNYNRYKIPRSTDIPAMEPHIVENFDPASPTGTKGIGEPALELIAPAIANALYRASGKRQYTLPMRNSK